MTRSSNFRYLFKPVIENLHLRLVSFEFEKKPKISKVLNSFKENFYIQLIQMIRLSF